jgi:hypothetical protein
VTAVYLLRRFDIAFEDKYVFDFIEIEPRNAAPPKLHPEPDVRVSLMARDEDLQHGFIRVNMPFDEN